MGNPWKTTRTCNHSRWLSWHNMYKSCNHWTVIMSHYRNYIMKIILLLRITTMKTRRDSTHPSHPTERFQRRCKAVDRHSAESNQWNGGIQQTKTPAVSVVGSCCSTKAQQHYFIYIYIYYIYILWTQVNRLGRLQHFHTFSRCRIQSQPLRRTPTSRWPPTLGCDSSVITCFLPQPATAVAF